MNINKLQAQLQHVPDQALIGYVQNPDGQVPSYLALAELSRRKEIRKSAQPQQVAPTQTVAAQEVAQVAPGIAQLPVRDDMYSEESYANGGIVAFAGGGLSEADLAYQEAINNTFLDKGYRGLSNMASGIGNYVGDYVTDLATLPGQARWVRDPATGKLVRAYETEGWMPRSSDKAPERVAAQAEASKFIEQSKPKQTTPAILPYADPRVTADRNAAQIRADVAAGKYSPKAPPAGEPGVGGAARSVTPAGIGSLYKAPTDISGEYEGLMRPETSARENMDKYFGLIGEDKGRAAMQERLGKMEARAAKDEAQAPWMALAEAGLGIASGKSQFALQNIAEGGKQGIKSFIDAKDRLVKAEERRFDVASKIAQAERAEQVAAATYGLQSEERAKAHNDTVKQAKLGYKADRESAIAKGNFDANKFKLEYAQKDREIGLMDKRIDKQIASAESQGLRYELTNRRDSLKTALNEVNDMLKNEQASLNPDPAKIAALQSKFDAAYNALYSLAMNPSGNAPTAGGKKVPLDSFNLK